MQLAWFCILERLCAHCAPCVESSFSVSLHCASWSHFSLMSLIGRASVTLVSVFFHPRTMVAAHLTITQQGTLLGKILAISLKASQLPWYVNGSVENICIGNKDTSSFLIIEIASLSGQERERLYLLASLTVKKGHITMFWPMRYTQKYCMKIPGNILR